MYTQYKHYDLNLEAGIIGACLLEETAFGRVRTILNTEMFYFDNSKLVFKTMAELFDLSFPIDTISVVNFLAVRNRLQLMPNGDSLGYGVSFYTNNVVSTANLEYHSMLLKQQFVERELIKLAKDGAYLGGDGLDNILAMRNKLDKLMELKATDDWIHMTDLMIGLDKHIVEKKGQTTFGVPIGFESLNRVYGGFGDTDLIVLAARPSVGKTSMLMKMVQTAGAHFKREYYGNNDVVGYMEQSVGVISLEMSDMKLAARYASMETGIEYWKIYRSRLNEENERQTLYNKMKQMAEMPIYVSDTANVDILDIKSKAMKLKAKNNLKILFIDYLQLIDTPEKSGQNREREVAKLSRGLKLLAMQLKIPIVLLAQLNRGSETEKDKKPKLYHLRESGAIEQDADVVLLLHRDWMSDIRIRIDPINGEVSTEHEADIIVAKWRDGELGNYKIGWDGARMEFYDPNENRYSNNLNQFVTPNQIDQYQQNNPF